MKNLFLWAVIAGACLLLFSGSLFALPVMAAILVSSKVAPKFWSRFWIDSYRACMRIINNL